jgi:hypothetical protein
MPTELDHQRACTRHIEFAQKVVDGYNDWAAIATFYSALHKVCEACATHGIVHDEHEDRNRHIRESWREVWKLYKRLLDESQKARYLTHGVYSLSSAEVKRQLIDGVYPELIRLIENRKKVPLIPTTAPTAGGGAAP